MKKLRTGIILILIFAFFLPFGKKAIVRGEEIGDIRTDIFLPTSYLQYYKLDNPYAIMRYEDENGLFVAISHKDGIVVYRNEKFATIPLQNEFNDAVSAISRYENLLLYLYESKIWSVDISDIEQDGWTANPVDTGLTSNKSFSILGDTLVTHNSDNICFYRINTENKSSFSAMELSQKLHRQDVSTLYYAKNEKVYYSLLNANGIYEIYKDDVSGLDKNQVIDEDARNVRTITEDVETGIIYYSSPEGIFSVNPTTKQKTAIKESSDKTPDADLGNVYDPYGICIIDGELWEVDKYINAVQTIDLSTNSFTDFAITTNSKAVNRLTASVKDIVVTSDKLYALDHDRIVIINDINGVKTYNRINLGVSPDKFSAGDGYIVYSQDKKVTVGIIEKGTDENILNLKEIESYSDVGFSVKDICYAENTFYLLGSMLSGGIQHAVIQTLKVSNGSISNTKTHALIDAIGQPVQISIDVFGSVYFVMQYNEKYTFSKLDEDVITQLKVIDADKEILNIQADMDGKIYCLTANDEIFCIENSDVIFTKRIKINPNLEGINSCKSFALSDVTGKAYFIFEGLILDDFDEEDLCVSTPDKIACPNGFKTEFENVDRFIKIKDGAKIFNVDYYDGDTKFTYKDYFTYEKGLNEKSYCAFEINERYCYIVSDDLTAIIRNADIESEYHSEALNEKAYAIVDFSPYKLPVLNQNYKAQTSVKKAEETEVLSSVVYNGTEYYYINSNGLKGYIPSTFITNEIRTEKVTDEITGAYVYNKNGACVTDGNGNEIDVISGKTQVKILNIDEDGKLARISYGDGKIGYVATSDVVTDSLSNILKAIAIIIASVSLTITALYFEKRYFFTAN